MYAVRTGASAADARPMMMFAANIPDPESELDSLDEKGMAPLIEPGASWVLVSDPESMVRVSRTARYGFGLWDHLLIGALLVALAEPWLANRLSRRKRVPAPGSAGAAGIGTSVRG